MPPMHTQPQKDPYLTLAHTGGWLAFVQASTVVFAIVGYFIWPHVFGDHDAGQVFAGIQQSPAVYFMRLDPIVLIGTLLQLPVFLGLWAVLRKTHAGVATLGLAVGFLSTAASLTIRPLIELYSLASLHEAAATPEMQTMYLAAGEALLAQFHGTAWAVSIMCGGLAAMLFAWVMRKTQAFRPATFWAMLLSGSGALLVLIPVVGIIALFLLGTVVGVAASILCGWDLLRFSQSLK